MKMVNVHILRRVVSILNEILSTKMGNGSVKMINKIIALVIIVPVALYLYIKDRIHNQNEKI